MPVYTIFVILLIILINGIQEINGARIVAVSFVSLKSHKNVYEPLLLELARKGHQITFITPIPSSKNVTNVREIVIPGFTEMMEKGPNVFEMKEKNIEINPFVTAVTFFSEICEKGYKHKPVKDLLKEKFDLVIVSAMFNECTFGLVKKFNAPVIAVTTIPVPFWLSGSLGSPSPPSFTPNPFLSYSDRMTFVERTMNFVSVLLINAVQEFYYFPIMEEIYRRHLNDTTLPSSREIFKDVSIILSNSHFSLNSPRPLMPQIVDIAGIHCNTAKLLPKDLEVFLKDTEKEGFIYFSMGSALQAHTMQEKYRKVFVEAFRKLKLKVLWKWETETMPDLPENVKLRKWLPQQDILGHPNIKLFITHGGLLSTEEAVYHGTPILGIPMYGDQYLNMKKSETLGYAITLDFATLTQEYVIAAINKILLDSKYKEKVTYLSKIFRDQPETPIERALFWTEYVLRHKGAPQLRSPAADLNFIQYHSLDVIAFIATILFTTVYLVFALLKCLLKKGYSSKPANRNKKKKI